MNTFQLARRAIRLFNNDMVSKSVNRHNQRQWIASVLALGDKWVCLRQYPRVEVSQ